MAEHHDLSGRWTGRYEYDQGMDPVPFEARLTDDAGVIGGEVFEPNTFAVGRGDTLSAVISGSHDGSLVTFVKTYRGVAQGDDPVYEGQLNAKATRIEGDWHFPAQPGWKGRFVMFRKPEARARKAAAAGALVDVEAAG